MFPVSDVIPSRTTPYVTIILILLNSIAFLYELQLDARELQRLVDRFGLTPADFTWTSVITSQFLHDGPLHFGANMLFLWIFGDNVEDAFGHVRYVLFYLVCGAAAAIGHTAVHPASPMPLIGASGAIAGTLGAYLVLYPRSRVLTAVFLIVFLDLIEIPAIFFLGIWFLLQLLSGVAVTGTDAANGAIAFWAHIAGFVAGAAAGGLARLHVLRMYWQRRAG
jgi:membrane associated rhomboid family serine protease